MFISFISIILTCYFVSGRAKCMVICLSRILLFPIFFLSFSVFCFCFFYSFFYTFRVFATVVKITKADRPVNPHHLPSQDQYQPTSLASLYHIWKLAHALLAFLFLQCPQNDTIPQGVGCHTTLVQIAVSGEFCFDWLHSSIIMIAKIGCKVK